MTGSTTTTVTDMRMDVAVAAVARPAMTALELVVLLTRALRLLAWEIYWNSLYCRVSSSSCLFVISRRLSWKEFHWLTAAKMAMVDRIGAFKGVLCMMATSLAGLLVILLNPGGTFWLLAGGLLYGTCFSIGSLGISMITRTLYGDAQYGSAYSVITLFTSVASAVGLTLIGMMYDITGSYSASVIGGILMIAIALACLILIFTNASKQLKNRTV